MAKSEDYIAASALAEKYGVTMSTIRRRIQEGKIFKGAKKVKMSLGEMWMIPRAEAEAVSLEELSPRVYQARHKDKIKSVYDKEQEKLSSEVSRSSLEERVSAIEQYLIKHSI